MRHAEKPAGNHDPDLAPAGKERALKLVQYIPATFGEPAHLFASKPTESDRPLETLQPLSENLGLHINTDFPDDDYAALAKQTFV
jgi:broad specificity phosphatase PhoE